MSSLRLSPTKQSPVNAASKSIQCNIQQVKHCATEYLLKALSILQAFARSSFLNLF